MRIIFIYFKYLGSIFPRFVAKNTFNIFLTPKRRKIGEKNKKILKKAITTFLVFKGKDIALYNWSFEGNKKTAFILHGWESMASDFYKIIIELNSNGYNVFSFDAPSHGLSKGKNTNVNEFKEAFKLVLKKGKISEIDVLIGHSLGGLIPVLALNDPDFSVRIKKLILLASPSGIYGIIDGFKRLLSLRQKSFFYLNKLIEKKIKYSVNEIDKKILIKPPNINSLYLIYDESDSVVSFSEGVKLSKNWGVPINRILDVGHYKMIKNNEVLTIIKKII